MNKKIRVPRREFMKRAAAGAAAMAAPALVEAQTPAGQTSASIPPSSETPAVEAAEVLTGGRSGSASWSTIKSLGAYVCGNPGSSLRSPGIHH
jgi:hypothetical protein